MDGKFELGPRYFISQKTNDSKFTVLMHRDRDEQIYIDLTGRLDYEKLLGSESLKKIASLEGCVIYKRIDGFSDYYIDYYSVLDGVYSESVLLEEDEQFVCSALHLRSDRNEDNQER
jgi:hypothetical protein